MSFDSIESTRSELISEMSTMSIHGCVITPGNSPIRQYGGVIYYTILNQNSPSRNNAVLP